MNRSDARGIKTLKGWIGEYRLCWKSTYKAVEERDSRGKIIGPRYFRSRQEAELAAWRELRDIEEPVLTGTENIPSQARQAAEALFMK